MIISDVAESLDLLYTADIPSCLWGDTGVGKSTIIKEHFEKKYKIPVVTLYGSQMDGAELQGLPYIDTKTKQTCFAPLDRLPTEGKFILVLEELNRAPTPVLQAMYQLINERRIGSKSYNCYVVAACNPSSSEFIVNELDQALLARFCHISVTTTSRIIGDYLQQKLDSSCPYLGYYMNSTSKSCIDASIPKITIANGRRKEWAIRLWEAQQKVNVDDNIYMETLCGIVPADEARVMGKYIVPIEIHDIATKGKKVWENKKFKEEEYIATIFAIVPYCENKLSKKNMENLSEFIIHVIKTQPIKDIVFGCIVRLMQVSVKEKLNNSMNISWHPSAIVEALRNKDMFNVFIEETIIGILFDKMEDNQTKEDILDMFEKTDIQKIIDKVESNNSKKEAV